VHIYKGSCHCGLVQFEIHKQEPIDTLMECNCSICTKKGILHTPVENDELVIVSGENDQSLYQFGTKVARYTFCPRCGCSAFHRSRENQYRYSVNARCLDDLDALLQDNKIWFLNGRDHPFDRNSKQIETLPIPYRAHSGEITEDVIKE